MSAAEACSSLLEAIDAKRTDIIKSILDHISASSNKGDNTATLSEVLCSVCCDEGTLLHRAVTIGAADAVRALLMAGGDPGLLNDEGISVIQMTEEINDPKVKQAFTDDLFQSIASSQLERVGQLLQAGVKTDLVDSDLTRNSALHWAASFGSTEVVQLLINNAAEVDATNSEGATPLHDAIQRSHLDIVKLFIESGADLRLQIFNGKHKGQSALELAQGKDALMALLEAGVCTKGIENGTAKCDTSETSDSVSILDEKIALAVPQIKKKKTQNLHHKFNLLWPRPKVVIGLDGTEVNLGRHFYLRVGQEGGRLSPHGILDVWEVYREELEDLGYTASVQVFSMLGHSSCKGSSLIGLNSNTPSIGQNSSLGSNLTNDRAGRMTNESSSIGSSHLQISINESLASEAYSLVITSGCLKLVAGDTKGLHYGIATLLQILSLFSTEPIPAVSIKDSPEMSVRGVLLDLAPYGRVPTVPTFISTLRILSSLKLNKIYLYTRLSSTPEWQLLYSPLDLISLDRQCCDRQMTLVPTLDIQQPCPFTQLQEYTIIFNRVLSCFSDLSQVNIGPCLSSVVFNSARSVGCNQVFPKIWSYLGLPTTTQLLLCCNSVLDCPQVLEDLPVNVCLVDYGFQADYAFSENADKLARSGLLTLTCPGTSAWNCVMGRPGNMINNIKQAAECCLNNSGLGMIAANWTGSPAMTHLSTALPGWVLGAGLAWNTRGTDAQLLGEAISHHVFHDRTGSAGQLLLDMASVESAVEPNNSSTSQLQTTVLLSTVIRPGNQDLENISAEQLAAAVQVTRRSLSRLQTLREGVEGEPEGLLQELTLGGELLLVAARIARGLLQTPGHKLEELASTFKTDIANKLLALIEQYRAVWLSRYLPGGLQDTILHLTNLLNALLPPSEVGNYTNGNIL